MAGRLWVILPTYNEVDNLEPVVRGVRAAVPEAHVLVVDDASTDGTAELADALADSVLHRPGKAGLGRAYAAGFAQALAGGAELGVEMDADLSHDPADLPRLIPPAEAGARPGGRARHGRGGGVRDEGAGAGTAWPPGRRGA